MRKHNFLNYTMKKPSLLKQSAEEGERTEKLKAGDEVIVNTYGQRGTLLKTTAKDNGKSIGHFKMNVSEEDMTPVAPQKKRNQELQRFVLQKAVMLAHN